MNEERNFDYQLNRVINWDGGRLEDVKPIAGRIRTSSDWKRELIALGDTAMKEGRTQNAIAYYRMSEFFMYDGDPDKKAYYEKATKLFYQYYADYFEGDDPRIEKLTVPLTLEKEKYDLATAFETVYFWPGLEKCFEQVAKVLKPGGYFLITNESDGKDATGLKFEKIIDGMKTHTAEEIEAALRTAGFSKVTCNHSRNPWISVLAKK